MSVHTPGPWEVWGDDHHEGDIPFIEIGRGEIPSPECKSICDVRCTITDADDIAEAFILTEEDRANAHLIAAGPSMLEALENIENDDQHMPSTAWELIQAAIAKARGPS